MDEFFEIYKEYEENIKKEKERFYCLVDLEAVKWAESNGYFVGDEIKDQPDLKIENFIGDFSIQITPQGTLMGYEIHVHACYKNKDNQECLYPLGVKKYRL